MRFSDLLITALTNLGRHKLRTALTVAGVTIGTTTVALMVSIAAGLQHFVVTQTQAMMASDLVTFTSNKDVGSIRINFGRVGAPADEVKESGIPLGRPEPIRRDQLKSVQAIPHVRAVYPAFSVRAESIRLSGAEKRFRVKVSPSYPGSRTPDLVAGSGFTGDEREVVLANQYKEVFGWRAPEEGLGQWVVITINRSVPPKPGQSLVFGQAPKMEKDEYRARVVGLTAKTAEGEMALVPYDYALEMARWQARNRQMYSPGNFGYNGFLHVDSPQHVEEVARAVRDVGLGALTPADQLGMINTAYMYLEGVLSVLGLVALAVAGLGISNTLVMAIYERTREIGVWKALGATRQTIRLLFTAEAAGIGFAGGVAGVAIAWAIGQGINAIARSTFAADFPSFALSAFPSWLVLAVISFSTAMGMAAGLLPANRAARLDPVAALRQE